MLYLLAIVSGLVTGWVFGMVSSFVSTRWGVNKYARIGRGGFSGGRLANKSKVRLPRGPSGVQRPASLSVSITGNGNSVVVGGNLTVNNTISKSELRREMDAMTANLDKKLRSELPPTLDPELDKGPAFSELDDAIDAITADLERKAATQGKCTHGVDCDDPDQCKACIEEAWRGKP